MSVVVIMERHVTVRLRSLENAETPMRGHEGLTPVERIALVWELTLQALAFQGHGDVEPRLSRHSVRVIRRKPSDII